MPAPAVNLILRSTFTPTKLPGLWGWWRGEDAVADSSARVSRIRSKRGPDWVQVGAADQPLLVSSQNSLPAVQFNGVNEFMLLETNSILAQPVTFYLALKQVTWTNGDRILSAFDNGGTSMIYQNVVANRISVFGGSLAVTATAPTLNFGVFAGVADGSSSAAQWNGGTTIGGVAAGTTHWRGGCLGANNGAAPSSFSNVEIGEICIYQGAHDESQRASLWSRYFKPRYGL